MATGCTDRFLVDFMLGRLVTWLRLLGCDTVYTGSIDDAAIAYLAQHDSRILLTRDRELARRKSIETILIDSDKLDEQLAQVMRICHLSVKGVQPRCALCNGTLEDAERSEVESLVPPYVFQTQERFLRCVGCGHIYWKGTHWEKMQERLVALYKDYQFRPRP